MAFVDKQPSMVLPRCRHCGRLWTPSSGQVASSSYCPVCSDERRSLAVSHLGLKAPTEVDFDGPYLLPDRSRLGR